MDDFTDMVLCLAQSAIERYFLTREMWYPPFDSLPEELREKQGVFTTLYTRTGDGKSLRGCIGIPYPRYPLGQAITRSAVQSAFFDPRFPSLRLEELPSLEFHVELLSPIRELEFDSPKDLIEQVKVGEHGLIIEYRGFSGLLLPSVPTSYGWDARTFLEHLSMKAGLPSDAYTWDGVKIFVFTSQHVKSTDLEFINM